MSVVTTYNTFEDPTRNPEGKALRDVEEFDDLLDIVGGYGKYQKRLLYGVFCPIFFFLSLNTNSPIFYLAVPDHWCHVDNPVSIAPPLWKNFNIPMEIGADGKEEFSQCLMYVSQANHTLVPCTHKWDYDHGDYSATIPSTYNWVCDKSKYATQLLTSSPIGTLFGTVLFGIGGDRFGRKRTLFLCLTLFAVFRTLGFLLAEHFPLFISLSFLAGLVLDPTNSLLSLIAAESTCKESRSWLYGVRFIVSTCGDAAIPIVSWLTGGNWTTFAFITTLPLFVLLLFYPLVPESARWLLAEGRMAEAEKVIQTVSETNGTFTNFQSENLADILQKIKTKHDGRFGGKERPRFWQLFSRQHLAINTALVSLSMAVNSAIAFGISVNVVTLSGSPFFNYFITSIETLPTGWVGKFLVERLGRRWINASFTLFAGFGFGFAILASVHNIPWLVVTALSITGFLSSLAVMIAPLQSVELFPTELRATGCGVGSFFGAVGTALAPSISALGQSDVVFPYIAFLVISIFTAIAISFLPETLNHSLPETLEEANDLGRFAKYWSFLPHGTKLVEGEGRIVEYRKD